MIMNENQRQQEAQRLASQLLIDAQSRSVPVFRVQQGADAAAARRLRAANSAPREWEESRPKAA